MVCLGMFRLINHDGRACLDLENERYDLAALSGDSSLADPMQAIARHSELHALYSQLSTRSPDGPIDPSLLGPPSPRPQKIFGIGLNYLSHAAESGAPLPPAPLTFTKFPSCLSGATSDVALSGDQVDWEVEIVVVVGDKCRNVSVADAWSHVAGLTLGQDISDRVLQSTGKPAQFCLAKSFDTYGPTGPAIVSVDSFADPDDIELWCDVSGQRMQHARTRDLIFTIPRLVAYLSSVCTLLPGDLIFTGTPDGVGRARGRYLRAGDEIVSGAHGIGQLHNRCVLGTGPVL
jgi:2,4-diketo-3-deoxy-L-fuconate hydrolase